jgi:hypothetical protein
MRYETWIGVVVLMSWATFARELPPTCRSCGRRYERRYLGEPVCRC